MKFYVNIFLSISLVLAPLAGLSAPIASGRLTATPETLMADIRAMQDMNSKHTSVDLKLENITIKAPEVRTNWSHRGDRYEVVTTAIVTQTPAEFSAVQNYIHSAVRDTLAENIPAVVTNILPDNENTETLSRSLNANFTPTELKAVYELPLSQVEMGALEKNLVEKGGILGKLQKSMRSAADWLTNRPKLYQGTFVISRTLMNGTAASLSILYTYPGIHWAVALSAGGAAGLLSGALQMVAKWYAPWLIKDGRTQGFYRNLLTKRFPKRPELAEKWSPNLAFFTKYGILEVIFVMTPISIFLGSDLFSTTLESSSWITSVVGPGFNNFTYHFNFWAFMGQVALSIYAQAPWDRAIAKLNQFDLEQYQNNPKMKQWIEFRTKGYFVGISALSVLALALSFGNDILGLSMLAAMGTLGLHVGNKAIKRAQHEKATCEDFLTLPDAPGEVSGHFISIPNPSNKAVNPEAPLDKTGS